MANSIYALLSKQAGLRQQVDLIAHNVANLGTTGFKREGLTFAAHIERLDLPGGELALADARASYTDFGSGPLARTGNPLDVAIKGAGHFAVETAAGVRYTRDGRFSVNEIGELVTAAGHRVLDEGGSTILIPVEAAAIGISSDGTLTAEDGRLLGVLGLHRLPARRIVRFGDGLFAPEGDPEPALGSSIAQGFVEASNVNPIREITDLIEAQRAYERGRAMLDAEDARLRSMIQKLDQDA